MKRTYLILAAAVLALTLVAAGCGGKKKASAPPPATTTPASTAETSSGGTLDGTVGPGFTIALTKAGAAVTTLPAGKYTLNVDDLSDIHNFHLTGPGVDVTTDIAAKGKQHFTITLKAGSYHFQCDPHATQMNGDFTVT